MKVVIKEAAMLLVLFVGALASFYHGFLLSGWSFLCVFILTIELPFLAFDIVVLEREIAVLQLAKEKKE